VRSKKLDAANEGRFAAFFVAKSERAYNDREIQPVHINTRTGAFLGMTPYKS
jgi:hypothetical protein